MNNINLKAQVVGLEEVERKAEELSELIKKARSLANDLAAACEAVSVELSDA